MKSPNFFLNHIVEAITEIENYTFGVSFAEFVNNSMRYNATVHQIEIIGEAVSNLDKIGFTKNFPEVPWKEIKGMRNLLIHEYWQIDLEEVYHSTQNDIPYLKEKITFVLDKLNKQADNSN